MNKFGTAVILAGGKSQRMGFDKQFLKINDEVITEKIIKILRKQFDEVIIVTNKPEEYVGTCDKVLSDEEKIKGLGPLSGIHVALKCASSKYVYFTACDMPNINHNYIDYMKSVLIDDKYDICITRFGEWIETFNSFYSKDLVDNIEEHLLIGKRSVFSFVNSVRTYYISEKKAREFSPDWNMFCNLNTQEDLESFLKD